MSKLLAANPKGASSAFIWQSYTIMSSFLCQRFLVTVSVVHLVRAGCFNPDGSDRNAHSQFAYFPCRDDTVSMCCRSDVSDPSADICTAEGLCYNGSVDVTYRESCTDVCHPCIKSPGLLANEVLICASSQPGKTQPVSSCS
jgi:hypothetical protein